ncbi:MAG TPA: SPOR domain-containing protein [Byssovorax sp.]
MRNLDEIQEDDPSQRSSRAGAMILASLGGACIVFAAAALMRSPPKAKVVNADPLGDLVAKAHPAGAASVAPPGIGGDVTFPGALSDAKRPTTALEAVREEPAKRPGDLPFTLPAGAPTTPPSAADRLPVAPLPAQSVLEPAPPPAAASDTLATMAQARSRDDGNETASAGTPGGYQLQVSSFKTQPEAEAFAGALRRRGHHAFVEAADVKGRGVWYRVRIGPFKYKHAALIYRQDFESKERMVTFIVDPPKPVVAARASTASVVVNDDD